MIIIKNLIIYNQLKNKILLQISELIIKKNSILILKGKSGAGKSLLLKTLGNEYPYFNGNIIINNSVIESYSDQSYFKILQLVNQNYPLFSNMTIYKQLYHVLYFIKHEEQSVIENKIKTVLLKLNLWDECNKKPNQISGGQRQRFAIIQKILLCPEYLLLDEPTSGLDKKSKFEILHYLLEENKKGMTLIIASHDNETINFFEDKTIYNF